jgi:hypothetical protein
MAVDHLPHSIPHRIIVTGYPQKGRDWNMPMDQSLGLIFLKFVSVIFPKVAGPQSGPNYPIQVFQILRKLRRLKIGVAISENEGDTHPRQGV